MEGMNGRIDGGMDGGKDGGKGGFQASQSKTCSLGASDTDRASAIVSKSASLNVFAWTAHYTYLVVPRGGEEGGPLGGLKGAGG